MDVLNGPVVVLDGDDCAVLGRLLVEAIRLAYVARGRTPPRHLLAHADAVNRVARGSAQAREDPQVSGPRGTIAVRGQAFPRPSGEPVWLSADEAARIAEVSVEYMRKCLRRGDLAGSRGERGSAWRIEVSEVAVWLSRRREVNDPS